MSINHDAPITTENLLQNAISSELDGASPDNSRRVQFIAKLTSLLGIALFILLALEGISVPFVGELTTWHVVIGVILIPVMTAKIVVTLFRFTFYYARSLDFKKAGPP